MRAKLYKKWNTEQDTKPKEVSPANLVLKQKAKAISDPILLFDKYEHERTEDAETFCQTLNMELMSLTGVICSLPLATLFTVPTPPIYLVFDCGLFKIKKH